MISHQWGKILLHILPNAQEITKPVSLASIKSAIPGPVEALVFFPEFVTSGSFPCLGWFLHTHALISALLNWWWGPPAGMHSSVTLICTSVVRQALSSCLRGLPRLSQLCESNKLLLVSPQPPPRQSQPGAVSWDNCTAHIFPQQLSGSIFFCCLTSSILKTIISYHFCNSFGCFRWRFSVRNESHSLAKLILDIALSS